MQAVEVPWGRFQHHGNNVAVPQLSLDLLHHAADDAAVFKRHGAVWFQFYAVDPINMAQHADDGGFTVLVMVDEPLIYEVLQLLIVLPPWPVGFADPNTQVGFLDFLGQKFIGLGRPVDAGGVNQRRL